jgi:hypothetical protein
VGQILFNDCPAYLTAGFSAQPMLPLGTMKKATAVLKFASRLNPFSEKAKAKVVEKADELYLFRCPECKNVHFRHAGYLEMLLPFIRADKKEGVDAQSYSVKICTNCRHSYIWYNEQMYDVTKLIDVEAWARTERELQLATGPGGDC